MTEIMEKMEKELWEVRKAMSDFKQTFTEFGKGADGSTDGEYVNITFAMNEIWKELDEIDKNLESVNEKVNENSLLNWRAKLFVNAFLNWKDVQECIVPSETSSIHDKREAMSLQRSVIIKSDILFKMMDDNSNLAVREVIEAVKLALENTDGLSDDDKWVYGKDIENMFLRGKL